MYHYAFKYKFHLIFFIALTGIVKCNSEIVNAVEGDVVHLTFQYPCDSTKVTLQHSYKAPFFNSMNPNSLLLPPNQFLRNLNGTKSEECLLLLEFNPVLRIDEGPYILTAYKNGQMLPEYLTVGLRIGYPPGKASCLSGDNDDDWIELHCQAPVGRIDGQIICYQNGIRLPSLHKPKQNDETLSQDMLARITDPEHVRCCSSTLKETRHMCKCMDWEWDPIHRHTYVLPNISNPCPTSSSPISRPTSSQNITFDNGNNNVVTTSSSKTPQEIPKSSFTDSVKMKIDLISESLKVNTSLIIVAVACTCVTLLIIILSVFLHMTRKAKDRGNRAELEQELHPEIKDKYKRETNNHYLINVELDTAC